MDKLYFNQVPQFTVATNVFRNVPTILQYDDTPLIEVVRFIDAGFTSRFSIFHNDGTDLARVVGSRLFLTSDGKKCDLALHHPEGATVCELNGKTLFEIRREGAAALSTYAELHSPDGAFIKCARDSRVEGMLADAHSPLRIGGMVMAGNLISGCQVGIWVRSDGTVSIGANPRLPSRAV